MQGHRVERSALHHDELRGLIIEPAQGPAHLILVVAVDEDELLAHGHEIERIHPLARAGDHIALVIENVLFNAHRRIEDPAPIAHREAYTGDGAWPTNTGFGFAGQLDRKSTRLNSSH